MATTEQKRSYCAIGNHRTPGGPGKWDWATKFFNGTPVTFTCFPTDRPRHPFEREVQLTSCKWVGDDGHSWSFEGVLAEDDKMDKGWEVEGYYSTKSNTGWMEILVPT